MARRSNARPAGRSPTGLYRPVCFLAGLNYLAANTTEIIGAHNAVIRVQPFIDHCSLPESAGERAVSVAAIPLA